MSIILNKKEKGSILIYSILTLIVISGIGLTLVAVFLPKLKLISESTDTINAIFAADSAIEWCLFWQRGYSHPSAVNLSLDNEASFSVYWNWSQVVSCNPSQGIGHQAVGRYRGIGRTFEVFE